MKYFNIEMYQKCEIAHYILHIYISNNEHLDFFQHGLQHIYIRKKYFINVHVCSNTFLYGSEL